MPFDIALLSDGYLRLGLAVLAGGLIGLDRELAGHWAGLRTHMLVALGAAVFVVLGVHAAQGDVNAVSRILQGVATGVGFLGAGAILKLGDRSRIEGLTTAGSIWLAAAMGSLAGFGQYELLTAALSLGLVVLVILRPVSRRIDRHRLRKHKQGPADPPGT